MSSRSLRVFTSNILLAFAYFAAVLNWLWLTIVALPRLIETGKLDFLTKAPQPTPLAVPNDAISSSPLMWVLVAIITLGILVMTIVVLIRLPRTIVRTGQKIVAETAEAVIPTLTHHKQLPAKKKLVLSRRIMLFIQLTLSLLPLAVCLFLPPYHELSRQIIVTIAGWLSLIGLIGFGLSWWVSPTPTSRTRSRASRG